MCAGGQCVAHAPQGNVGCALVGRRLSGGCSLVPRRLRVVCAMFVRWLASVVRLSATASVARRGTALSGTTLCCLGLVGVARRCTALDGVAQHAVLALHCCPALRSVRSAHSVAPHAELAWHWRCPAPGIFVARRCGRLRSMRCWRRTELRGVAWRCTGLRSVAQRRASLHDVARRCTALPSMRIAYCTALYGIARCCMTSLNVARRCAALHGVVVHQHGMAAHAELALRGVARRCAALRGVARRCTALLGVAKGSTACGVGFARRCPALPGVPQRCAALHGVPRR